MIHQAVNIFWFRRDLRLEDNAGLHAALTGGLPVLPIFIFDRNILDKLEKPLDRRVEFIFWALERMQKKLVAHGSSLLTFYGKPVEVFKDLLGKYECRKVFTSQDYEPYARERDDAIARLLKANHVEFISVKDQVIFDKDEVVKDNGEPYTIFTPYSRKWKSCISNSTFRTFHSEKLFEHFEKIKAIPLPAIEGIGFRATHDSFPDDEPDKALIQHYDKTRDYPGTNGTTHLGVHLRFGTISVRKLAATAIQLNEVFLNELIWRDFFQMILWHFPDVGKGGAFKKAFDSIRWRNNEKEFELWCTGKTGYPIVDAGMRELVTTGYMHNRVRMVAASFLAKHLLIDWRWGEAWFAKNLLDYDLASNNGNWQWAAGCGCDAAPWFRIFNPLLQAKKFDKEEKYIRKWIPELDDPVYPKPIVDHEVARERCLKAFGKAVEKN